jgi:hypothetical protein
VQSAALHGRRPHPRQDHAAGRRAPKMVTPFAERSVSKAAAAQGQPRPSPPRGRASAGCLPGQRAPSVPGHRLPSLEPALPVEAGPAERAADAPEGAGSSPGALWLPAAARAAPARGLAGQRQARSSSLS